jgi:pimeloyl-ACP methyl ester carboxylesterase
VSRLRQESDQITRRIVLQGLTIPLLAAFRRARAQGPAVDWEGFVRIGGIEQWISIRGESAANPVVLFLHGGPGEALSPFPSVSEPWEQAFTVLLWDQRGSGRTHGRNPSAPEDMTLERLTQDAIEIAEYALNTLGKDKLILAGQSWGSIIGWTVATKRPDLFHAYVGTGQAVSWMRTVEGQESYARAQAEAAGDEAALQAMDQAREAPLDSFKRTAPYRAWIMPPSDLAFIEMLRDYIGPEPIPRQGDVAAWVRGSGFSLEALGDEILRFDAYATGLDVAIPVVVIQGRDDHVTPFDAAAEFVRDIRPPAKKFVAIDGGHFACYTNAEAFAAALAENVVPFTTNDRSLSRSAR